MDSGHGRWVSGPGACREGRPRAALPAPALVLRGHLVASAGRRKALQQEWPCLPQEWCPRSSSLGISKCSRL